MDQWPELPLLSLDFYGGPTVSNPDRRSWRKYWIFFSSEVTVPAQNIIGVRGTEKIAQNVVSVHKCVVNVTFFEITLGPWHKKFDNSCLQIFQLSVNSDVILGRWQFELAVGNCLSIDFQKSTQAWTRLSQRTIKKFREARTFLLWPKDVAACFRPIYLPSGLGSALLPNVSWFFNKLPSGGAVFFDSRKIDTS